MFLPTHCLPSLVAAPPELPLYLAERVSICRLRRVLFPNKRCENINLPLWANISQIRQKINWLCITVYFGRWCWASHSLCVPSINYNCRASALFPLSSVECVCVCVCVCLVYIFGSAFSAEDLYCWSTFSVRQKDHSLSVTESLQDIFCSRLDLVFSLWILSISSSETWGVISTWLIVMISFGWCLFIWHHHSMKVLWNESVEAEVGCEQQVKAVFR